MQEKKYDVALEDYLIAAELDLNNLDILYNTGVAFDNCGQLQNAITYYSKVLEKDRKHELALKARARAYYRLGDKESFQSDS